MRYLITLSYDGSKFYGFQRLKDKITVQQVLEKGLTKINKKSVIVKGAGRTDRGVHACNQKCHFDLDITIEPNRLKNALNSLVGDYIYIKDCIEVDNEFHARFNVLEKEYIYKISFGEYNPLIEDYTLQLKTKLDIKKMKKAAKIFLGEHNFSAFVSGSRKDYTAFIKSISFYYHENILYITFVGKNFYQYMVRNIVGALIEVGKGNIDKDILIERLNSNDENVILPTAKAGGLYLFDVRY